MTLTAIAAQIGLSPSTVSREVKRNSALTGYRAVRADRLAQARTAQPRLPKLAIQPELRTEVEKRLAERWSPQQISRRLAIDFPDDPSMRVSHETIYTSLFMQAKGGLPGQLTVHLRTRRVRRRPHRRVFVGPRRIGNMVHISQRPAEVALRIVAGHWEGDLVVGQRGGSHVGTLVERSSRYLVLLHLPDGAGTDSVINALIAAIEGMPRVLRKSVTWDWGIEMTRHLRFSEVTGVPVFFCDARSPRQRGTNENTNGLLRQYLPKGSDLTIHSAADLQAIADQITGELSSGRLRSRSWPPAMR